MTESTIRTRIDRGIKAWSAGWGREANPYPAGSTDAGDWDLGWTSGHLVKETIDYRIRIKREDADNGIQETHGQPAHTGSGGGPSLGEGRREIHKTED